MHVYSPSWQSPFKPVRMGNRVGLGCGGGGFAPMAAEEEDAELTRPRSMGCGGGGFAPRVTEQQEEVPPGFTLGRRQPVALGAIRTAPALPRLSRLASPEMGCDKCKRMRKKMRAIEELSGRRILGQTCSVNPPPTGLNCQRTSTGDIICSDGQLYAGDCPNAPAVNVAGVAADVNGAPVPPGAPSTGGDSKGSDESNTLMYAAGGIAAAGLLFALFG